MNIDVIIANTNENKANRRNSIKTSESINESHNLKKKNRKKTRKINVLAWLNETINMILPCHRYALLIHIWFCIILNQMIGRSLKFCWIRQLWSRSFIRISSDASVKTQFYLVNDGYRNLNFFRFLWFFRRRGGRVRMRSEILDYSEEEDINWKCFNR